MAVSIRKKKYVINIVGLALALMLAALNVVLMLFPASAQDTDMQEFVSAREFFSVQAPADWQTEEVVAGIALVTANSEAAFERHNDGNAPESGDFVVNVGFLPFEVLRQRQLVSLNIQFETTPDIFLQSFLPIFHVNGDAVVGDVELVSLSDTRAAGLSTFSDEGREGTVMVFVAGEDVLAFVSTVGFPGEMGDFQEVAYAIAARIEFSGSQDALFAALWGR